MAHCKLLDSTSLTMSPKLFEGLIIAKSYSLILTYNYLCVESAKGELNSRNRQFKKEGGTVVKPL